MTNQMIFVSYSREDSALVIKLATELKDAGANLWLDQLDIAPGSIWDNQIESALETCNCLLFIVSKSSVLSNNVLNEVYYALEDNKIIIPVKINDCKIPFRIKRLQYIDLSLNYEQGIAYLLKTLKLQSLFKTDENKKTDGPGELFNEDELWLLTKNKNSKTDIQFYLQHFPEGKYAAEAINALAKKDEIKNETKPINDGGLLTDVPEKKEAVLNANTIISAEPDNIKNVEETKITVTESKNNNEIADTTDKREAEIEFADNDENFNAGSDSIKLSDDKNNVTAGKASQKKNINKTTITIFSLIAVCLAAALIIGIRNSGNSSNKEHFDPATADSAKANFNNISDSPAALPVKSDSLKSDSLIRAGMAFQKKGKDSEAIQCYNSILLIKDTMNDDYRKSLEFLGSIYSDGGNKIKRNKKKAFNYYLRSAELGDELSMFYLSLMYEYGEGTRIDHVKAKEWQDKSDKADQ